MNSEMVTSVQKTVFHGTHRAVSAETTWKRITPMFAEAGITRLADVTGLDDVGIPVFMAVRPAALTLSVSQGKGVTSSLARVSGAMEALELWHAEQRLAVAARSTARELQLPYDPADLQLATPTLLTDTVVMDWVSATDTSTGASTLVPLDYVRLSSVLEQRWWPPLFKATSNGLASGNTFPEALAHAVYELIERDCVAELHRQALEQRNVLDMNTVTDPDAVQLLDLFTAAENIVNVYDATNNLEVPCYEAEIWSPRLPLVFSGAGCHLDPAVALCRALTEAAQNRLTTISGTRDDIAQRIYSLQALRSLGRPPTFESAAGDGPSLERVRFGRWPIAAANSFAEDLALLAARLAKHRRTRIITVDLTRPGWPVAVVKAITPGLGFDIGHERPRD